MLRLCDRDPVLLRRSRGYVPGLVTLRAPLTRVTLGLGGGLKTLPPWREAATCTWLLSSATWRDPLTLSDFQRQVEGMLELYAVRPEAVAFDPHPLYHSSSLAAKFPEARRIAVQHHHAHALA